MAYKIYKQLIPAPLNENDPEWAKRQIWVAKLNSEDTVETFTTLTKANARKLVLETADPTGRLYKVEKI